MIAAETMFRSVEAALAFAFSEQYTDLPQSPASRMASTPSRSGNGLGGVDGYAQAGMILARVELLGEPRRAILTARFSKPLGPCPCGRACCKGVQPRLRWLAAVACVSDYLAIEIPALKAHRHLREVIVRRMFGDKTVTLGDAADRCGVHRNTASNHNNRAMTIIRGLESAARYEVRCALESAGVIDA